MLMTPGPTAVPASVRDTMSRELINPDVDPAFHGIYNRLTDRLATVYGVDSDGDTGGDSAASTRDIVVPGGEGILGLEAAIASLVEPGTEVLCLSNGLYGDGFADFVADYGGEATLVSADYDDSLPLAELESVLADDDREFDLATMVHCETPTGTLNDLGPRSTSSMRPTRRSSPSSTPSRRSAASGCRQDGSTSVSAPLRSASARRRGSLPPRSATARGRRWRSGTRIRCTQISSRGETLQRGSRTPTLRPRSWRSTRRSGCS